MRDFHEPIYPTWTTITKSTTLITERSYMLRQDFILVVNSERLLEFQKSIGTMF